MYILVYKCRRWGAYRGDRRGLKNLPRKWELYCLSKRTTHIKCLLMSYKSAFFEHVCPYNKSEYCQTAFEMIPIYFVVVLTF